MNRALIPPTPAERQAMLDDWRRFYAAHVPTGCFSAMAYMAYPVDDGELSERPKTDLIDARLEEFHLWAQDDREPSMVMIWLAAGVAVTVLIGLAYLARAVL
jgi:hypothetical protein